MLKISIIEDRPEIRNSLVRYINRNEGLTCISNYGSGEEALENLPKDRPNLVLMDIGLPKMNGVECMIRLGHSGLKTDYLMFTVFDDDVHVFEALKGGAIGYVLKSEGGVGVIKAIKEYEQGGAPMSRNIARKVLLSFNNNKIKLSKSFDSLTKRQSTILELISQGLLNKEIAARLGISERTVKQHNNAIYKKLQVFNRTEAVRKYLDNKL